MRHRAVRFAAVYSFSSIVVRRRNESATQNLCRRVGFGIQENMLGGGPEADLQIIDSPLMRLQATP